MVLGPASASRRLQWVWGDTDLAKGWRGHANVNLNNGNVNDNNDNNNNYVAFEVL